MTLKARLLLASLVLSLTTTLVVAAMVGRAWQNAERARFDDQFRAATEDLTRQLEARARAIHASLEPLCAHDPLVDSALIGHHTGQLGERLLPVKLRLPEQKQALGLDELALVTDDGQLIAGSLSGHSGTGPNRELARRTRMAATSPGLREVKPLAFEAACLAREGDSWVGLVGVSHIEPFLASAGQRHGIDLQLEAIDAWQAGASEIPEQLVAAVRVPGLDSRQLVARRDRTSLRSALRGLTLEVATAAATSLALALLLAWLIARGLSRPVVAFAERTRKAVQGSVEHIEVSGGPELAEAARAFNRTLDDLQALRLRLQATERIAARREVARQVAHEIKNPLFPIRTSVETLRKLHAQGHPQFEEFFDEATNTVLEEVRRIGVLVESFSSYARLPSPRVANTDLSQLVVELCRLHSDLGAEVDVQVTPDLTARVDRDQISQVVTNLLKNAVEATAETPSARVEVVLERVEERIRLQVWDNGPGVPAEFAGRLFEPYATTKKTGTGLGLPISHRIAVEHGGDLTYASRPVGACFTLLLPPEGPPAFEKPDASRAADAS